MTGEMRATDLALLKALARLGAMHKKVQVTSSGLAGEVGLSQQAASAALIRLQSRGYVERGLTARGQIVKLSHAGVSVLRADYAMYKQLFEEEGAVDVTGTVANGLGEGSYYLSRPAYRNGLRKMLGAEPYMGTLNVKLQGADLDFLASLRGMAGEEIPGFEDGGRTFGPIKCFNAEVGGVKALVIIPARTHYTDVMELVAAVHLRGALGLEEGKSAKVRVHI